MVFTEWQQVWFIQRFPVKRKNRRIWKVQSGRVVSDPGKENLRVKIHVSDTDSCVGIRRRCVFTSQEKAEAKCDRWNNWARDHAGQVYHKTVKNHGDFGKKIGIVKV